jgi:methyl-accepting chemotaxis protein
MPLQLFKKQQRAPPVERVKELSSHGFSEPEIIDVLRKEGYTPQEIDLALTQALKEKLQAPPPIQQKEEEKIPSFEDVVKRVQQEQITQQPVQQLSIQHQQAMLQSEQQYSWEDYFNYIDYLIHSRISEITKELGNINLKYQNLERRIEEINQNMKQTIIAREETYNQILKKIEELNNSFREVSQRISVLEELFKEILPALIESVRSLTKIAQGK